MDGRRLGWWLTGAGVVAGAFVLCAGIPLGVVYLLAQLDLDLLPSLAIGVGLAAAGMLGVGAGVARLHAVHVRLGPPPPPGLEPGSILLEASVVVAAAVAVVLLAVLFL